MAAWIEVSNRQRRVPVKIMVVQQWADRGLLECLDLPGEGNGLTSLPAVNVVLVSDARIAKLHERFFGITGPTDVITFQHGEIVISVDTAQRQAKILGHPTLHELGLYIVHGLLHLAGFDDRDPAEARRMKQVQRKIVRAVTKAMEE